MINKNSVKQKSEELNIPFSNLLSAAVCEAIIEIISNGKYCNELYLTNGNMFSPDIYRDICVDEICYEYIKDIDEKMAVLFMRDILKEIIAGGAKEALIVKGQVEEGTIKLKISCDEMYVPITISMRKHLGAQDNQMAELKLTMYSNQRVKYLMNTGEEELVIHLVEIIDKLELINDMDHYYIAYEILSRYPINGRKVNDRLRKILVERGITIDSARMNLLKSYVDYTYMKKKWKVELRQKKRSDPSWPDTMNCIVKFLTPIWDTMEKDMIFLGDWMPGLKRFLD
ncbi:MAG: hypothetical protein K6E79_06845 [Pseudobutyrivibrio sp.]|nr:hypothetical protein [Pseudobutyrivibrio sp.]